MPRQLNQLMHYAILHLLDDINVRSEAGKMIHGTGSFLSHFRVFSVPFPVMSV